MKTTKCIALIRVSTTIQDLDQQENVVLEECRKDGYKDENIIIIKNKESASKLSEEERIGLTTLKETIIEDKKVDCVYIYELSRLARKPNILYSIRDFLIEHNIQLIVVKPYMRMLEDGKLSQSASIMFALLGSLAENEIYLFRERSMRGMKKRMSEGKTPPGFALYGYETDSDGYAHIKEEEAKIVRRIYDMCSIDKMSGHQIGKILFAEGTFPECGSLKNYISRVSRTLRTDTYTGKKNYPPIISEEQFEECVKLRATRQYAVKTETKYFHLCRNLLYDNESGINYAPIQSKDRYRVSKIGYSRISIPMSKIDSWVWEYVKEKSAIKIDIDQQWMENNQIIHNLLQNLHAVEKKEEKLTTLLLDGKINERVFDAKLKDIKEEMKGVEAELNKYKKEGIRLQRLHVKKELQLEVDTYSDQQKRELVFSIIKVIKVTTHKHNSHHIDIYLNDGNVESFELDF